MVEREKNTLELSDDDRVVLLDLIRSYQAGKKAAIKAIVTAVIGAIVTAIGYGLAHWIKTLAIASAVVVLFFAAGCFDLYQSQTTVIGVEVAYDPMQSAMPTARAGVITHRQQAATKGSIKSMSNFVDYYQLNVWSATGSVTGEMSAILNEQTEEGGK